MKIITIVGARPQFIKSSTISQKINEINNLFEVIIHTGQHFDLNMSDIFFKDMNLSKPNYTLGINQMDREEMIAKMVREMEPILSKESPDGILVYGDTNSTLAGTLVATKFNMPIFHVEAGLRSYNQSMPEEINRLITDHLSTLLFCPTNNSVKNLEKEGVTKGVFVSGDVMYDAFINFNKEIVNRKDSFHKLGSNYILATIHRPENTDFKKKLISIFSSLDKLNRKKRVVMPLHPRTRKKVLEYNITTKINILPPQGYLSMLSLLNDSELVITDSGGLQKEAFFAKKKCITIRNETEWVELIASNTNILSKPNNVIDSYYEVLNNKCNFSSQIFGNGNASEFVINSIMDYFKN